MRRISKNHGELIETWPAIARAVGKSVSTVRRWARLHGFPVAPLPNGDMVTTQSLIDNWILARRKAHQDKLNE